MPRSKNLHVINFSQEITQGNDPTQIAVNAQIDMALELSKQLGRNIRQGQQFRLVGYGASLQATSANYDVDTGMSASVRLGYAPVTKHSVNAWNMMFKKYQRQKQLNSTVGRYVRHDDFEACYKATLDTSRTSRLFAGGLGDDNDEYVSIYDTSSSGVRTSMSDLYNSANPITPESRTEFGVTIKGAKYQNFFPEERHLYTTAHMSSMAQWTRWAADLVGTESEFEQDSVHYMGGSSESNLHMLPADNHIGILCGLMNIQAYVLPPDVDSGPFPPTADELNLNITLIVEGWSPLAKTKKTYPKRKGSSRSTYKPRSKKARYMRR